MLSNVGSLFLYVPFFVAPSIIILSVASSSSPTVTVIMLLYLSVKYCLILVYCRLLCCVTLPLHCPLSPSYVIIILLRHVC